MIAFLKSNKFINLILISVCIIILLNPNVYVKACLNGISVWAIKIFPVMFPFFVFSRAIISNSSNKASLLDKYFNKLYRTNTGSLKTFLLSCLAGYPMGAKLICLQYNEKLIDSKQAKKMLSFCSVSGPMFMVGTVGISILGSYSAGLIILISNIIACLINGLIFRGDKPKPETAYIPLYNKTPLGEQISDSLNSILLVGAYIVLSFLLIEILKNLNIINTMSSAICCVFNINAYHDVVSGIICGMLEITRGIIELNASSSSLLAKTIIASGLIGFGGFSIFLQTNHFIEKLGIQKGFVFLQKLSQGVLALIVSSIICILFI